MPDQAKSKIAEYAAKAKRDKEARNGPSWLDVHEKFLGQLNEKEKVIRPKIVGATGSGHLRVKETLTASDYEIYTRSQSLIDPNKIIKKGPDKFRCPKCGHELGLMTHGATQHCSHCDLIAQLWGNALECTATPYIPTEHSQTKQGEKKKKSEKKHLKDESSKIPVSAKSVQGYEKIIRRLKNNYTESLKQESRLQGIITYMTIAMLILTAIIMYFLFQ